MDQIPRRLWDSLKNSADLITNIFTSGTNTQEISSAVSPSEMGTEEPNSMEVLARHMLYPERPLHCDDSGVTKVPYTPLSGEFPEYLDRTTTGVIVLSDFRLLATQQNSFINIPVGLIDTVEVKELFTICITSKDATSFRFSFATNEASTRWYNRICTKMQPSPQLDKIFAFCYHAHAEPCLDLPDPPTFGKELERMQFQIQSGEAWRISYINSKYELCESYPKEHIVPAMVSDEKLKSAAGFRAIRRFPSVVWRNQRNGAVIVRSSQPEYGLLGWRNEDDETLLSAIIEACNTNPGTDPVPDSLPEKKRMLVIDCRSYSAAFANRAKGGGFENMDTYTQCELQFMNLVNIHNIRKCFQALRQLCAQPPDSNWMSSLDSTKWLLYVNAIVRAAMVVVSAIDKERRPVLVHCSDGWDRTPQVVALAELLLDPEYRTIQGFRALVEREWMAFGHKFADRCGHKVKEVGDPNERSPVFLQWLDCVFQIHQQFPTAFEFNEGFLMKLLKHTYSCLYGTFLCNSQRERDAGHVDRDTASVWSLLRPGNPKYTNHLYKHNKEVLYPDLTLCKTTLWNAVYLSHNLWRASSYIDIAAIPEAGEMTPEEGGGVLPKTRSCEDITSLSDHSHCTNRRMSDPSIVHTTPESSPRPPKEAKQVEEEENNGPLSLSENGDKEPQVEQVASPGAEGAGDGEEDGGHAEPAASGEETVNSPGAGATCSGSNGGEGLCGRTELTGEVAGNNTKDCLANGCLVQRSREGVDRETPAMEVGGAEEEEAPAEGDSATHPNGHLSEEEAGARADLAGTSPGHVKCRSMESSTDTLVSEEPTHREDARDAQGGVGEQKGDGDAAAEVPPRKSLANHFQSMSTSTSDISDSHVLSPVHLRMLNDRLTSRVLSPGSDRRSVGSSPSSSPNSRTPTSTCPPTPGADVKVQLDASSVRPFGAQGINRHLDEDGLTQFRDPVQERIMEMKQGYEEKLAHLQRMVDELQRCPRTLDSQLSARDDEQVMSEDGDYESLGTGSNATSESSWEMLDEESGGKLVPWMPNEVATNCAWCGSSFTAWTRKHHCRKCGNVLCSGCCSHYMPLPDQMLPKPVRVCKRCVAQVCSEEAASLVPVEGLHASAPKLLNGTAAS